MLNPELLKDIEIYCKLNNIDIDETINKCLRNGFNHMKYKIPSDINSRGFQPIADNTSVIPPQESGTVSSNNIYSE